MQKSLLTKRLSPAAAETLRRYLTALLSLVFFALGVTLMSRSQLGISPIQSVAYVVYNRLAEHTTLGTVVLCWNCVQVLAQWPLLGRFGWKQLVQIPLSLFLGVMVDATGALLFWLQPDTLVLRLLTVLCGVAVLSIAVCLNVSANAVMNAGEALEYAISQRFGKKFSTVKECTDIGCVTLAVVLSFLFFGRWRFDIVGAGTLLSATLAGLGVRLLNPWIKPAVERFCTGKNNKHTSV